jgi:hypothetical protein
MQTARCDAEAITSVAVCSDTYLTAATMCSAVSTDCVVWWRAHCISSVPLLLLATSSSRTVEVASGRTVLLQQEHFRAMRALIYS